LHFHFRYRKTSWEPLVLPDHPNDIEDPLFRLVSRVRFFFCKRCGPQKALMDRPRGEFMRPWDQVEEPARTERILARPFVLYKDNVTDAIDSMKLLMMNRASGFTFRGVSYDLFTFCAQLLVAILTGLAPVIPVGSPSAMMQMFAVLFVQWFSAAYIGLLQPSVDRFDALIQCAQFSVEGTMTLMLILSTYDTNPDAQMFYQSTAFYLALGAMGVPILEKVYDAVIVQLSKLLRKDEFTWQGCFFALIALLVSLPGVIAAMFGIELGLEDMETIIDEAAGATEMGLEDLAIVGGVGLDAVSDLFSNAAWLTNPLPRHHKAAVKIQRFRREALLQKQSTEHRAAARLQASFRGKTTRREYGPRIDSIPTYRELHSVDGGDARRSTLTWLNAEEKKHYFIEERLGRARAHSPGDARRFSKATMASDLLAGRLGAFLTHPSPHEMSLQDARSSSFASRRVASASPGVATLRDDLVSGVGIVYTRARPGRQDLQGLRSAATRLKLRVAKRALPSTMPPRPVTLTGAGSDFTTVVHLARARQKEEEEANAQAHASESQVSSADMGSLDTLTFVGSFDTLTADVGSFDTLTAEESESPMQSGTGPSQAQSVGTTLLPCLQARSAIADFADVLSFERAYSFATPTESVGPATVGSFDTLTFEEDFPASEGYAATGSASTLSALDLSVGSSFSRLSLSKTSARPKSLGTRVQEISRQSSTRHKIGIASNVEVQSTPPPSAGTQRKTLGAVPETAPPPSSPPSPDHDVRAEPPSSESGAVRRGGRRVRFKRPGPRQTDAV